MSLSPPSNKARSGLARSNGTRAGYPIGSSAKVPLYALSNVARSGATRSNYTSGVAFISIGGVQVGGGGVAAPGTPRILYDTLTITDALDEAPNTAQCVQHFGNPTIGQAVSITIGSVNNLRKDFTGTILSCRTYYVGTPDNLHYDLNLIDDTLGLNTRKVWAQFNGQTVAAITTALRTTYAPSYTQQVDATIGAIVIDQISFAARDVTDCLTQLMKRAGAHWKCDYGKKIVIGPDGGTDPRILNAVHPSLLSVDVTRDYSQVVTRVLSEGGGGNALQQMTPGETVMPLDTGVWYEPSGVVTVGAQRITYTSVELAGGGSLVGPGAAPSAAMVAALAPGAGVTDGAHDYAVSFVTASGESLAGPRVTITVGLLTPPAAPTVGTVQPGPGPDTGVHQYAVSFVTATGETPPGATASATTGVAAPPATAPVPGTPTAGGNVDQGFHDYALTFVTATGETTPGPIGGGVATSFGPFPSPTTAPTPGTPAVGGSMDQGTHQYAVTFHTATGETTAGPLSVNVTLGSGNIASPGAAPSVSAGAANPSGYQAGIGYTFAITFLGDVGQTTASPATAFTPSSSCNITVGLPIGPLGTKSRRVYIDNGRRAITITNNTATTYTSTNSEPFATAPPSANDAGFYYTAVPLTNIPTGPSGTTIRHLYRQSGGAGLRSLDSISNNTTTTYTDTAPNSALGAAPPTTTTAQGTVYQTIPLTAIETGPSGTTARKLYRRSGGAGLRFLATLANNTTTTYTDTTANASLGAAPPVTNTATSQQVPLTIATGGPLVTARKVWGTAAGASQLKLIATVADNTTTAYLVTTPDVSLGANAPTSNTATGNQVQLSSIPLGAAAVTQRKLYRSAANTTTPLKLLATIADNTTATYLDAIADASLGANAPGSDTSGLQQPSGAVLAGSTSLIVAGVGAFKTVGGWAVIGNGEQVIRYTGISGNTLTGIPASGIGSIVATIAYNSTVTSPAHLRGIPATGTGAILFTIPKGEPVNLLVTENNVPAQTTLGLLLGTDGIQEDYLSDNRLSALEARARAKAWLALRKDPDISVRAETRDRNTATGRTLTVNLGALQLYGVAFVIQSVTEHTFTPAIQPHFTLQASTDRFTFEDFQRMIKEGLA